MSDAQTHRPRRILQSIGAMLAGALTGIILSIGTDALLHATAVFPPSGQPMADSLFLLATVYRTVYGILGSYVVAWLAPDRPMWHAMVIGFVGLAVTIVGTVATWNRGPTFGPHWYPLTLVALALPTAWAGAKLRIMQSRVRADN